MPQPNILIFMTDHQRADTALPEHPAITPNLDRFAREGVTFTNTFCPSPHCCPARATFFTGLYPTRHGVWNNICNDQALSRGLKPGVRLWSEDLAAGGYALHFSGKWHVSVEESPADRGWTEHFVSGAQGTHHGWTWEQYRRLAETSRQGNKGTRGEGEILRPGYGTYRLYGTGEVEATGALQHDETALAKALDVLPKLTAGEQPWCLFVGLIGPHDPYIVPQKYLDMYDLAGVPLPPSYADDLTDKPAIYQRMRETRFGQLSEREVREGIRHFWAYCTYLDDLFGQLLAALDATGQRENTLVLYTSDHGDYCSEHGLFAKGIPCFQGAYRVPAVMRWPAGITNPGRRADAFVSLADFGPTFQDLAARPDWPSGHVEGRFGQLSDRTRPVTGASLLPFLVGERPPGWRDEIHTQCNGVELYYTQRSVMTADFKYVFNGFDRDELYDLRVDPHEMRNLAADPAYEPVKRELCGRMWRFAYQEDDAAINPYITVGLAPYGPAEAFRDGGF
jgi:arylsulfatase A-like enzyme